MFSPNEPQHEIFNKLVCATIPTNWCVRAFRRFGVCDHQLLEYFMTLKPLTDHHLEFLGLKGGCIDSSESTLVKSFTTMLEITCRGANSIARL